MDTVEQTSGILTILWAMAGLIIHAVVDGVPALARLLIDITSFIAQTLYALLSIALAPVTWCIALFTVILAPITYTLYYTFYPLLVLVGVFGKLQPLYIYLGSAAFVGLVTGACLTATAQLLVSVLGYHGQSEDALGRLSAETARASKLRGLGLGLMEATDGHTSSTESLSLKGMRGFDDLSSSAESDWAFVDRTLPRAPMRMSSSMRRRLGLQSQTILEEDDSE